jgi:hypothetical protein
MERKQRLHRTGGEGGGGGHTHVHPPACRRTNTRVRRLAVTSQMRGGSHSPACSSTRILRTSPPFSVWRWTTPRRLTMRKLRCFSLASRASRSSGVSSGRSGSSGSFGNSVKSSLARRLGLRSEAGAHERPHKSQARGQVRGGGKGRGWCGGGGGGLWRGGAHNLQPQPVRDARSHIPQGTHAKRGECTRAHASTRAAQRVQLGQLKGPQTSRRPTISRPSTSQGGCPGGSMRSRRANVRAQGCGSGQSRRPPPRCLRKGRVSWVGAPQRAEGNTTPDPPHRTCD